MAEPGVHDLDSVAEEDVAKTEAESLEPDLAEHEQDPNEEHEVTDVVDAASGEHSGNGVAEGHPEDVAVAAADEGEHAVGDTATGMSMASEHTNDDAPPSAEVLEEEILAPAVETKEVKKSAPAVSSPSKTKHTAKPSVSVKPPPGKTAGGPPTPLVKKVRHHFMYPYPLARIIAIRGVSMLILRAVDHQFRHVRVWHC